MPRPTPLALVATCLALTGCVFDAMEVELRGSVPPVTFEDQPFSVRAYDGTPEVDGRRIHLPFAGEDQRYGVHLIDTDPLPPGWRLPHARDGGLMIAQVDRGSPLALAGARPYDVLLAVDGQPPAGVAAVASQLAAAPQVRWTLRQLDGQERTIEAAAVEEVQGKSAFGVPFLLQVFGSETGSAVQFGPGLCWFNSSLRQPPDEARYHDFWGWGFLVDIVHYRSLTDPVTGEVHRQLTLFWFLELGSLEDA